MRAYLIDEISTSDMEKINGYLRDTAISSGLQKVYWVQIPEDLLNEAQIAHKHCQPYVFAVELGSGWIKLEFFSRSRKGMKCSCQTYSSSSQLEYITRFVHEMLENLGIET
jgi:hypothetical protein